MKRIALNTASALNRLIGYAVNQRPIEAGEWQQITPYGDYPNKAGLQRITRSDADAMVTAFNVTLAKAGRLWRGLPIYVGHPDFAPDQYPDKRRYGRVNDLEAREDGLWGRVAWNTLGTENQQEGYYVYPSGAWLLRKNADGTVSPTELVSVGLTNTPNIPGVEPWTANSNQPAGDPAQPQNNNMPTWLLSLLGLKAEATEDEIKAALAAIQRRAADAEAAVTALQQQLAEAQAAQTSAEGARATAESAAANERRARAGLMIDVAINEGRVLPADRDQWLAAFNSGFAGAEARLAAETKKLNTATIELRGARASIATYNERQALINTAVNERMQRGEDYDTAYANVKTDPQYAGVFAAMQAPNSK